MIAQVRGTVAWSGAGFVVVDVGGVGYKVAVPMSVIETLPETGQPVTLRTLTLVREDDISLYGFLEEVEQRVFELLLTVSGVGPKVALALLSVLSADDLARAVSGEDVKTLTKVPGVGARTAQRIVLELRDKLQAIGFQRKVEALSARSETRQKDAAAQMADDVVSALLNLGYNKVEAQRATDSALADVMKTTATPDFFTVFRAATNRLTK